MLGRNMVSFTAPIVRQLIKNTTIVVRTVARRGERGRIVATTLGRRRAEGDQGEIEALDRASDETPQPSFHPPRFEADLMREAIGALASAASVTDKARADGQFDTELAIALESAWHHAARALLRPDDRAVVKELTAYMEAEAARATTLRQLSEHARETLLSFGLAKGHPALSAGPPKARHADAWCKAAEAAIAAIGTTDRRRRKTLDPDGKLLSSPSDVFLVGAFAIVERAGGRLTVQASERRLDRKGKKVGPAGAGATAVAFCDIAKRYLPDPRRWRLPDAAGIRDIKRRARSSTGQ